MADNERIFLFWGEDLRDFEPDLLLAYSRAGSILLPANAGAMQKARQSGVPFMLPEDWLGLEITLQARWAADDWEAQWFVPAREALSSDGICWPVFDKEALNWYWRDLTLADALVRACRERGLENVSLVLNNPLRPALGYQRSDIHCHLIRAALGDRVTIHETFHDPWPTILSPAISLDRLRKGTETVSPERIAGRIVLALNPGEFHRFTPVIRELCSRFSGRVAVIALWPSPAETRKLAQSCPADVFTPELAPAMDVDLGRQFFAGYLQALAAADGKPWAEALKLTRFQFDYYCGFRLPVLAVNYRSWLNIWQRHKPAVVITSSLPDSEAQIPALAAGRAGIPTVSLPHGGFGAREQDCHARHVLYNCEPTRRVYAAAGIQPERLRPCREGVSENEYPAVSRAAPRRKEGRRILVLTNPVKFDTCLFNTTMIGSQIAALQALADQPADLSGKIDLLIKTHPNRHDRTLFEQVDSRLARCLLPPDVPLAEVLDQVDLVVALNYPGTALIYTLKARKPVIFFWNDPLLLNRSHSYRHSYLMLSAGEVAETGETMWRTANRFFNEPDFAASLRNRADAFARVNLDMEIFPSLSDIIEELTAIDRISEIGFESMMSGPVTKPMEILFPGYADLSVDLTDYVFEYGGMPVEELRILCALIRGRRPRSIFEIGTFKGGTTICMAANSLANIYTLDLPPKGHWDYRPPAHNDPEIDVYPDMPGIRFRGSTYRHRIKQIFADSRCFEYSPYFGKMDLVFVDACHHHDFVLRDSMNAFKMRSPGGMIIWHDYAEYAPGVMRALETVHSRFPLVHIAGTSLVVYPGVGEGIFDYPGTEQQGIGHSNAYVQAADEIARTEAALLERIARSPGDVDALVELARMEAAEGRQKDAQAFLQDALILDPAHPPALSLKTSME